METNIKFMICSDQAIAIIIYESYAAASNYTPRKGYASN